MTVMRILFIINGLGTGGAERSLAEMLPLFEEAGVESIVACLSRRSEGVQDPTRERGSEVVFLHEEGWAKRLIELRQLGRRLQPDLLVTTIFQADVSGRLAALRTDIPVITTLVNTSYEPVRLQDPSIRLWRLRGVKAIDGWTARRLTTHFHAITDAVKVAAVRDLRIRPEDITVVQRGRDAGRLGTPSLERRMRARRMLGLDADGPVVATVGRQEFQKGQWHLLEATALLLRQHPDLRVLLAGRRGHASSKLEEVLRSSKLNGEVQFLGHRDDAPEILAAADVFAFPSLYEGLGGALIEAMALGLPIVASDIPAIREVVEPNGNALLVTPSSPVEIANALDALLRDEPRRRTMGARSRQIFQERFTLERSATGMLQLFDRVAAAGRRPRS